MTIDFIKKNKAKIKKYLEGPTKNINNMSKKEVIKELQNLREIWQGITTIHQDMDDERLKVENMKSLKKGLL